MTWIKAVAAELLGLFVDDWIFALSIVAWIAVCWLLLPSLGLPLGLDAPILALGLAATLAASALRAARR